jgi:hypothetical protein
LLTVSFNRCEGNTIFTFLIQVFLKIDQHQMLMGFCLIEMKNIAVVELLLPPTVATKVWTGAYTSALIFRRSGCKICKYNQRRNREQLETSKIRIKTLNKGDI